MRLLKVSVLLLAIIICLAQSAIAATRCSASEAPIGNVSFINLTNSGVLEQIKLKFPEKQAPDASVILNIEFVYEVTEKSYLNITFLHSGGGVRSSFAYYIISPNYIAQNVTVLFPDQTCARVGDIVTIGPFEKGTKLGFTITSPQNGTDGSIIPTFWSNPNRFNPNPDNISHVSILKLNGKLLVGFEDLFNGGDKDFNDIIVSIDTVTAPTCPTACPEGYWLCCGSFLEADFGKILAVATALGLVIERLLEAVWSCCNASRKSAAYPPFRFALRYAAPPLAPAPGAPPVNGVGFFPGGAAAVAPPDWDYPFFNRRAVLRSGSLGAEEDEVEFEAMTAAIAYYQKKSETNENYLSDYFNCVQRKARFQARMTRKVNRRIIASLFYGIIIGCILSLLANLLFSLCWCIWWMLGIGIFAGILSPFIHQLFELAFRLQRYLKP